MNEVVTISIPVSPEAASMLRDERRRAAVGRYLSGMLTRDKLRDLLAEAIAEAKADARASGLTDQAIDTELERYNAERRA